MSVLESEASSGMYILTNPTKAHNLRQLTLLIGKMLIQPFKLWLGEVFFSNVCREIVLLIDLWNGHSLQTVKHNTKNR